LIAEILKKSRPEMGGFFKEKVLATKLIFFWNSSKGQKMKKRTDDVSLGVY
jgi:hypothetical protein